MRSGRTLAFVVLALLVGGIVSQLPSALADDSENPFSAIWDAIFDLQSRDDDLQAQIDELRAERNALAAQTGEPVLVSDLYAELEVETTEDGHTLVYVTASNGGPDKAAGVKLTTFYLMPLFEINSISGDQCEDKSRGIIECVLGTLEEDQEFVITIDATARESGEANTWTVDVSTTTDDSDYANNYATYNFETGSGEPIEIPEVVQPEEEVQEEIVDAGETEAEPQDNSGSNSTSTETEQPQASSGNQTSTENETEETSGGNQTSAETEETVQDSGSNSTDTEGSEGTSDESSTEEESSSEESPDGAAEHESQDESSQDTGEEQTGSDEQVEEEDQEEQGASEESGTEESDQDGSESDNNEESSGSEQESSDGGSEGSSNSEDSSEGGSESGAGEENPSQ